MFLVKQMMKWLAAQAARKRIQTEFDPHNATVQTHQCRRARLRRDAKALLHEMKKHSKNPAAL